MVEVVVEARVVRGDGSLKEESSFAEAFGLDGGMGIDRILKRTDSHGDSAGRLVVETLAEAAMGEETVEETGMAMVEKTEARSSDEAFLEF